MEGNLKEPPNIINISFEIPDDENISMLISVIKNRKIKISLDVHSILKDLLIEAKFKKTGNQFMLKAKLIELLIKLARHTRENRHPEFLPVLTHESNWNNDLISKIKKYLDKNFYKNLSSSDLNKKFGVSLGHLCRVFKKQTSVTISQYLNNLKMNEAKYLLRKSSLNVSQIAENWGIPIFIILAIVLRKICFISDRIFTFIKY